VAGSIWLSSDSISPTMRCGGGVEDLALFREMQRPRRALQEPARPARVPTRDELATAEGVSRDGRGRGKALERTDPHEGGHLVP